MYDSRTGIAEVHMSGDAVADDETLELLVTANHILAGEGVLDAFGHISVRHPDDPSHFLISRSLGPERATPSDIQRFTVDNDQVAGDTRPPYAERVIHAEIYRARPDVFSICHNHAPSIIPFGITGFPLRPIFHMAALFGTTVPTWDISNDFGETSLLVRTPEQGASLARTLGKNRAALMRGHGSVVIGQDVVDVTMTCIYMELNARMLLQAQALPGSIRYLSDREIQQAAEFLVQPLCRERAWDTWRERALRR